VTEDKQIPVRASCARVLKPLVRLLLRQGVAAGELADLCNAVYVEAAADMHRRRSGRINQSTVAIVTGLTRAEVKRLLAQAHATDVRHEWHRHRAMRVLTGWHQDRRFLSASGRPRTLTTKGPKSSFAKLVRRYGGDIPPRSMLDVLLSHGAITRDARGSVKVRTSAAAAFAGDARTFAAVARKASSYLQALATRAERPDSFLYEASAYSAEVEPSQLALLKRLLTQRAATFMASVESQMELASVKRSRKDTRVKPARLGTTVLIFEED
jgi:hypothetical protein